MKKLHTWLLNGLIKTYQQLTNIELVSRGWLLCTQSFTVCCITSMSFHIIRYMFEQMSLTYYREQCQVSTNPLLVCTGDLCPHIHLDPMLGTHLPILEPTIHQLSSPGSFHPVIKSSRKPLSTRTHKKCNLKKVNTGL